ncbi:polar amino acid transport system substrate-binding protein [Brucella ovis]|nr:polar amino acid transport system substrate-binding protein [Brucella ovis]
MKFAQILATAGIIQAVLFTGAMAGENLDAIKSAGVLKIGTEGTYAPSPITTRTTSLLASTWRLVKPSPESSV